MPFLLSLRRGQSVLLCFLVDLTSPPPGITHEWSSSLRATRLVASHTHKKNPAWFFILAFPLDREITHPSEQLLNITFYLNRRMRILFVLSLMLCYNAAQFADPSEYNVFLPRSILVRPSIFLSSCPATQSAHMGKAETSVRLLNIWLLFLFNFFRQFSLSAFLVQKLPSHICFSEYP